MTSFNNFLTLFMLMSCITISNSRIIDKSLSEISNTVHVITNFDVPREHSTETPTTSFDRNYIGRAVDRPGQLAFDTDCNITQALRNEIRSYQKTVDEIFKTVLTGAFKGRTYDDLGYFVDKFGSRLAGSKNLENAIDFLEDKLLHENLDNVHGEEVTIPHWVRGEEKATLISPRTKNLALLGLGFSVGTPKDGITASVLVVRSFDELRNRSKEVEGKIVVYNEKFTTYGETVKYRGRGASEASKYGAVATLIRSVTPFSINSPHTGMQTYEANVTKIPTACITIEDAELLQRFQDRGEKIVIQLKMDDVNLPFVKSRNLVAEITGREKPNEVVVVSGHMDSWDVGQGAMDDGGGMMISAQAVALLKFLKLQPRRTLRAILWTTEEFGLWGVQSYIKRHAREMEEFVAVFESDIGTFQPVGLDFSGSANAGCIVQEVLQLLKPYGADTFRQFPEVGSDIGYFIEKGVPGLSLNTKNDKYFWFHHSQGDTMTVENSHELDLCTAVWAASSYVLADLTQALPRT